MLMMLPLAERLIGIFSEDAPIVVFDPKFKVGVNNKTLKLSRRAAKGLLEKAHGETKTAIVMHLLETSYTDTRKRLSLYGGSLRGTLESYS